MRCTTPRTICPSLLANSAKMLSRSASRTRWRMTCLARWASMRPNCCGGNSCSSSSPSSAAGLRAVASARLISASGSSTLSTTFLRPYTRRAPVRRSSSMRTFSGVFLAADSRADSSASKRTSGSIPFSRPICSITAISSRFTLSSRPPRPRHLDVEPGLRQDRARNLDGLARALEHQPVDLHLGEPAGELVSSRRPASHRLADRPAQLALLAQQPIQPRRGHFQVVASLDESRHVEDIAQFPARLLAVLDPHAARLVDEHSQDPPRPGPPPVDIDELQSAVPEHGLDDLLDPRQLSVIRHGRSPKSKKWAAPTFSGL